MGAIESGEKVATQTVEAMKGNPSCLAAIIFASLMALLTYAALQLEGERNFQMRMSLVERCFPLPPGSPDDRDDRLP